MTQIEWFQFLPAAAFAVGVEANFFLREHAARRVSAAHGPVVRDPAGCVFDGEHPLYHRHDDGRDR